MTMLGHLTIFRPRLAQARHKNHSHEDTTHANHGISPIIASSLSGLTPIADMQRADG
jgi:hypothetical protein